MGDIFTQATQNEQLKELKQGIVEISHLHINGCLGARFRMIRAGLGN